MYCHLKEATSHHCRPPRRLDDPKLCKNFLLGFCPGEEFQRTKHDYGTCALDHDEAAKAQVREPSTHPACCLSAECMVTPAMLAANLRTVMGCHGRRPASPCIVTAAMNLYVCQGMGSSPWLSGMVACRAVGGAGRAGEGPAGLRAAAEAVHGRHDGRPAAQDPAQRAAPRAE